MCNLIGCAVQRAISRRGFLAGSVVGASALSAFSCSSVTAASGDIHTQLGPTAGDASNSRTRLILLGTAGGPTWWPNSDQCGIASAVAVGDAYYLIDCGEGVGKRLQQAIGAETNRATMSSLRALFLTHLHSDHTVDYPNLLLFGLYAGLERAPRPMKVFGPGRRNQMEPIFAASGSANPNVVVVNPENPTPGTADMTAYLRQAYATDLNDRVRDNGKRDILSLIDVHDIAIPHVAGFSSPNESPAPKMDPFKIYEDDRVKVTATLVNHFPVWPAFAYRFDSDDGSIVFSGDTGPCDNLIKLSQGADVLVHEVIVTNWARALFPQPRSAADEALLNHLLSAHTPVEEVGRVAEAAGVKTLVLSHIVPGNATHDQLLPAKQGFSGQLIVGRDLMKIGVARATTGSSKG